MRRFVGERQAGLHRFQWLPFGAGPRMCLGATFATMSVSLMLATLMQRCAFRPLRPTTQLIPASCEPRAGWLARCLGCALGCRCCCRRRHAGAAASAATTGCSSIHLSLPPPDDITLNFDRTGGLKMEVAPR